jgi:subtilisin family serine protease
MSARVPVGLTVLAALMLGLACLPGASVAQVGFRIEGGGFGGVIGGRNRSPGSMVKRGEGQRGLKPLSRGRDGEHGHGRNHGRDRKGGSQVTDRVPHPGGEGRPHKPGRRHGHGPFVRFMPPLPGGVSDPPLLPPRTARPLPRPRGTPPAPVAAPGGDMRGREVLVTLADGTADNVIAALARAYRLSRQSAFRSPTLGVRLARLRIPDRRPIDQVLDQLALDRRVLAAQPVFVYVSSQGVMRSGAAVPQYAVGKVRLEEAHLLARGRNVRIAVVDTSVDASHPELKGALVQAFDVVGANRKGPEPHGTAIAGILAARQQLRGMAPEARILAVRAFSQARSGRFEGTTETLIKGIDKGLESRARVFNLSFTGPRDPSVEQIIRIAEGRGAVFVAAAGNGGPDAPAAYPAAYDVVIAVTAVDSTDRLYERANRGNYITVAAPGVDILALAPKQSYELSSGTSLAAAHVSGIVALLMEHNPDLKTIEIRDLLTRSARGEQSWPARDFGAGIVDAARALEALREAVR